MDTNARRLRLIALFEDLSEAELAGVAATSSIRSFTRGSEITGMAHADRSDSAVPGKYDVYFILSGTVRANSISEDGREIIFSDLGTGDIVGEFAALDGGPRASSMVATSDCLLARMPAAEFAKLLQSNSTVALRLIQLLVAKIRRMSQRVFEVSALAVSERVRLELLRLAGANAREVARDGLAIVIRPAPTHYELAARIGSHREAVTRELNRLEDAGVVQIGRREIRITDLRKLRDVQTR